MSKKAPRTSGKTLPREVRIAPSHYQPRKAEMEEEIDMSGWAIRQMRDNLLGPVRAVHHEQEPSQAVTRLRCRFGPDWHGVR
ncbi:MAG: hypothetical protein OXN89_03430 [Bryobacterales bacterium]|nr:hypothetical protein [Bryobacterales bacterium]